MKTVVKGEEVKRVKDAEGETLVKSGEWKFCKKTLWKTKVRDLNKKAVKAEKVEKVGQEETHPDQPWKDKRKKRREEKEKKSEEVKE